MNWKSDPDSQIYFRDYIIRNCFLVSKVLTSPTYETKMLRIANNPHTMTSNDY